MSIIKTEIAQTTGTENNIAQVFYRNHFPKQDSLPISPFTFNVPLFGITGATLSFYTQTTDPVSTNLNNSKTIKYDFTANTESLSGTTQLKYDLYRVKIEDYLSAKEDLEGNVTGSTSVSAVESSLSNPFVKINKNASGITSFNPYTLTIPQIVKPIGEFAEQTFLDKSQYFIDTRYVFDIEEDLTLGDRFTFSGESVGGDNDFVAVTQPATVKRTSTIGISNTITGGTFSGFTVNGAFFVYFKAPNKPGLNVVDDTPTVRGTQPTFSPIFNFNNVEDGDFYKLQVSYDTSNVSFSGDDVVVFIVQQQEGDPEFIRTFSTPLNPSSDFLYRIGNTKQVENIFGVKHSVTTWSVAEQAKTATDGIFDLIGTTYYNRASSGTTLSAVTLTLTLKATTSNVDVGADSPKFETIAEVVSNALDANVGSVQTVTSDSGGTFSFTNILGGTYTLKASHPDFTDEEFTIIISEDENINIIFDVIWGSTIFTFADDLLFV